MNGKHLQKRRKGPPPNADKERDLSTFASAGGLEDLSHCFHISIAWTLEQPTDGMRERLVDWQEGRDQHLGLEVSAVKAKIGNTVTSFPLTTKKDPDSGII